MRLKSARFLISRALSHNGRQERASHLNEGTIEEQELLIFSSQHQINDKND